MKRIVIFMTVVSLFAIGGVAHAESLWYDGCITKQYGWGEGAYAEHGNDLSCFGFGTPVTALLAGTVSDARWTSFGQYTVTWRLDNPQAARGSPYAYFTDLSGMAVWTGEHVTTGQTIGYSLEWVEFGLTPDWSYGVSNWRWGIDSMFLIQEARNGTIVVTSTTTPTATPQVVTTTSTPVVKSRLSPPIVITRGSLMGGMAIQSTWSKILQWKYYWRRAGLRSQLGLHPSIQRFFNMHMY